MLKKKRKYNLAIVGATGVVGLEMLRLVSERNFPVDQLRLFASPQSAGKKINNITVESLKENSFENTDIALFSAGSECSKKQAPLAVKSGAIVIDNSSAFRMDPKIPLVIPEINPGVLKNHRGIIANPNCTTIIMLMAVFPIHKINPVKKITVSSYQAVSGAGAKALQELKEQQADWLSGKIPTPKVFRHVIANNLFSHDSEMLENGYNQEEMKMVQETQKILNDPKIAIAPTCVRVPIERSHSEAITLELSQTIHLEEIKKTLKMAPGLQIQDDPKKNHFPMPLETNCQNNVFIGRIRKDLTDEKCLHFFVCGDQLLKGAALNAFQIAEELILM